MRPRRGNQQRDIWNAWGVCTLWVGRRAGKKSGGWGNGRITAKEYVAIEALQRVGRAARQVQVPAAMCKAASPACLGAGAAAPPAAGRATGVVEPRSLPRPRTSVAVAAGEDRVHGRGRTAGRAAAGMLSCVCVHCVGVTVRQVGIDGVGAGARGLAPQGRRRWRH